MSYRLFEKTDHAKAYAESRPCPPEDLIQRILDFLRQSIDGEVLKKAVDLGCGSGQCTFILAKHFQHVLGTDISQAQIQESNNLAEKLGHNNVEFKVSPGEVIPVEDASVQLITICTAAHYMNLDQVYDEGRRVLVPGGVMAIFSAGFPTWHFRHDTEKDAKFQYVYTEMHERCLKYLTNAALEGVQNKYRNITIPYKDLTRGFDYMVEKKESLQDICKSIQSWSYYQKLAEVEGQDVADAVVSTFRAKVQDILSFENEQSEDPEQFLRQVPYFLVMARV